MRHLIIRYACQTNPWTPPSSSVPPPARPAPPPARFPLESVESLQPRAAPGVGPDERDTMRHSEHAQSLHSIALCSGRRGTEGGRCPGRGMAHAQCSGVLALVCPGTVGISASGHRLRAHQGRRAQSPELPGRSLGVAAKGSPPRRRRVAAASPPRRRRVAALTPLSMWQEEAPLLPGVAFRVASRRREAPLGGVRLRSSTVHRF